MVRLKLKPLICSVLTLSVCGIIYLLYVNSKLQCLSGHACQKSASHGATKIHATRNRNFLQQEVIKEKDHGNVHDANGLIRQRMLRERADEIIEKEFDMFYDPRYDENLKDQVDDYEYSENANKQMNDNEYIDDAKDSNGIAYDDNNINAVTRNNAVVNNNKGLLNILEIVAKNEIKKTTMPFPHIFLDGKRGGQNLQGVYRDVQSQTSQFSTWLSHTNHVHGCVTGDIIGDVPQDLVTLPFRSKGIQGGSAEDPQMRQKSFQDVFQRRAWGHDWDPGYKGLNASGMGATLNWAQEVTATLHSIVNQIKQKTGQPKVTLLDVPCGDMAWMQRFLKTRDDILYTGMDIVPQLIENHKKTYGQYTQWQFVHRDVLTTGIGQYDLILSRMMMQHLYNADIVKLLQKLSQSGSKYILMTSFAGYDKNQELNMDSNLENPGRFRTLNMELSPFLLTPALCIERDGPPDVYQGWDHFIGLWELPLRRIQTCDKVHLLSWKHSRHKLYSCVRWTDKMDD